MEKDAAGYRAFNRNYIVGGNYHMKKFIKNTVNSIRANAIRLAATYRSGEGYIDTAVKILIAVVLGALLLAGLYALFGDVVMPTLNKRITEMFNYAG